jgi:uncharacterized protein with von Willebrand factor type A (vWA) domain
MSAALEVEARLMVAKLRGEGLPVGPGDARFVTEAILADMGIDMKALRAAVDEAVATRLD